MCPRGLPPKTSIQGCLSPSLYHPDLVLIPQIIRGHSFSEAHCPFHRRPLLPFKSAFHTPHFPSIFPPATPARIWSRSTVSPSPYRGLTPLPPYPAETPRFPLRLFAAGRPHPHPGLPIPHQPAPGLPSPLSPRDPSLSPSRPPRPPPKPFQSCFAGPLCSRSRWPPLSNWPRSSPRRQAQGTAARQPALPGASRASRLLT